MMLIEIDMQTIDVGNQREMDVLRDELGLAVDRLFNGVEYPPPLPGLKY
jgi:hypothetical protein